MVRACIILQVVLELKREEARTPVSLRLILTNRIIKLRPKQVFKHVSTGDIVKVNLTKDRKNVLAGIYTGRVKTPTNKGCEVVINGFRVGFSNMNDIKIIHSNDGYTYGS